MQHSTEVDGQNHAPAVLYPEKKSGTLYWRLGGPSEPFWKVLEKQKTLACASASASPGIRTQYRPARS